MEKHPVKWTGTAKIQLREVYVFIAKNSLQQADRIFDEIVASTFLLEKEPYRYPKDKYKTKNPGVYRAYEIYRYRVSYRIGKNAIYIVRVRSTYRNPKRY